MCKSNLLVCIFVSLSLSACANQSHDHEDDHHEASMPDYVQTHLCKDPRPQMCTMDYQPVCASLKDGSQQTFSNGCTACGDATVESWETGQCALDESM